MTELPQSIESEQALLWSMIIDNHIISALTVKDTDFYDPINQKLFKAINTVYDKQASVDILSLSTYLKDKSILAQCWWNIYIVELTNVTPTSSNFKSYDSTIKAHSNSRKIIYQCDKVQKCAYNNDNEKAVKEIEVLSNETEIEVKKGYDAEVLTNKVFDFIENYNKSWALGYPSPHKELDKVVPWIIPWKVYVVVAPSNTWKSNFTYPYVVDALKQWKKVIFFSLEVWADMLTVNLLKSYYKKSFQDIRKEEFYNEFKPEILKDLTVYDDVYDFDEICSITEQEEPDIIFIDFIQNVRTDWQSTTDKMSKVAKWCQRLAIKTNTTVFYISQVNNESKKDTNIRNLVLKWSWDFYDSSDVIFSLGKSDMTPLEVCVMKNKFWPAQWIFPVKADFATVQFEVLQPMEGVQVKSDFTAKKIDF